MERIVANLRFKPRRRALVAGLLLLVPACASVDYKTLDANAPTAPAQWTASSEYSAAPSEDWIADFNDETLRALIYEALANNNDIRAAAANLDAARSGAGIRRADLLPQIGASFDPRRSAIVVDPTTAAQAGGSAGNSSRIYINNYSLGGSLRWELDVWGRLLDETRASYKDANAAAADLAGARLSIAARTAQSWFSLIEARQQRELAERDVTARENNLSVTNRRYERGVSSSLDVRLARSALGSSQANLALRQRLEKEAARALEVLLGRYPSAELEAASALPGLPTLAGVGAPGEILARRPDLIAAEFRMESAGLRARAARKQLLPQFTLTSSAGTSGERISDLIDPNRLAGNLAGGIFQPLFQGGRLISNANRQRSLAEASLFSYIQTALSAYEEAENALAAEALLEAREIALQVAYEEAAAAEELTDRRYQQGAATIFNLLDAQTRRISAEGQYIQAKQQRVANRVQLYLAIGGNFNLEQQPTTIAVAEKS